MCERAPLETTPNLPTIVAQIGRDFNEFAFNCGSAKLARNILREKEYHTFEIGKKGTSEKRLIEAPNPELKQMQKRALEALEHLEINAAAHGFRKGKNNATAAAEAARKLGVSKATVIGYDLRKAFPTITRNQIKQIYKTTYPSLNGWQIHALARICCREGRLATGSPASPHLLNLVAKKIDDEMTKWCEQNGGVFIRYADDCVVIIYTHNRTRINEARKTLRKVIRKAGFTPHPEKNYATRIGLDTPAAEVVGAKVSPNKVRTRKSFRKKIRARLHQLRSRLKRSQPERKHQILWSSIKGQASYSAYLETKPYQTKPQKTRGSPNAT